jgi:hypothetical protein
VFLANGVQGSTPFASALRVLVNGDSASLTLKPETIVPGPFEARQVSLLPYAGQKVEVCFETRTGISQEADPFNRGDKIHLDNIIIGEALVNTSAPVSLGNQLKVYPNPGREAVTLEVAVATAGPAALSVTALTGQEVLRQEVVLSPGAQLLNLNTESWAAGVYQVVLDGESYRIVQKWVKL